MNSPTAAPRRWISLALAAALVPAGILWRKAPLHLPWFLFKYGGSALWAAMVYWLVAAALPRLRVTLVATVAAALSLCVELSRLLHPHWLDTFRETLAGQLILGRYFSLRNIAAYWLAIATAAWLDSHFRPGRARSSR